MTTTFKAKFDRGVLIPQQPLDLREGEVIELEVKTQAPRPLQRLAELAAQFPADPESPRDGAAQHDHYLYGTPKRDDP